MSADLRPHALGDSAITISFGEERSPALLRRIHAAARAIMRADIPFVEDVVPAYLALTVFYNPLNASYDGLAKALVDTCSAAGADDAEPPTREHVIAVRYDGIDLPAVSEATGLSVKDIVARHSGRTYAVDILGFVPGFAYLSELDPALQLPRRAQPRPRVAAGSVAIAAAQTAVYPLDTPGGWHIIGTTTEVMFDPRRDPAALLSPGDRVRFERLT
ncbi:MAG TPA: 5-oxoprolinase subunit PxpB [Gemmatimonadaceae bacterium]|jgi:KipI family sensor histidine kinase inhibitor|nr:5-oxoprolinase subunit PxpB [Gemmatimonadaceae bacterium]